jgi:hypothetical protein
MGQKTNPIEVDLSSEDGTQTGMVEMIMLINFAGITKSESISMLVYQKLIKSNYRENFKLVTVAFSLLLDLGCHCIGRWAKGRQVKEELRDY